MPESRIAQFSTSPLLQQFAVGASQKAIRPIGMFIAPICEAPDLTFRYKKYTEQNRYRIPNTRRQPGDRATRLTFSADDILLTLEPNALDFPIPNANQLSDEGLQFAIMEGQTVLADAAALALENEQAQLAKDAANASPSTVAVDFADPFVDPVPVIDQLILDVSRKARNGAPVRVVFGTTKFKKFRNNPNVLSRYKVSATRSAVSESVGLASPQIEDVPALLSDKPDVRLSLMVIDQSQAGQAENIQFLLDDTVLVFACNETPNRMDASFMKTFARFGEIFRPGAYTSEDERDEVMKMDWTTKPVVTNSAAVGAIN